MADREEPKAAGPAAPAGQETSDEELLSAFLRGEREMFTALVQRYERPLYGYLCRLTGSAEEADDVFQETFLQVWRKADSFRGASTFRTWLYAVAINVSRSRARRRRGRPDAGPFPAEQANGAAGPDGQAQAREVGRLIAGAVGRLPAEQREVFVLRAYEEMTYPEIADSVGRPLGTVKSQMRLALARLQRDLTELGRAWDIA
jgi:RNA polymerase sigma-70 factor (ECF subfamily)